MRVEWVRGRGLHKDIALMLRFSVCMYQHLFRYHESTFNARHVLAHESQYQSYRVTLRIAWFRGTHLIGESGSCQDNVIIQVMATSRIHLKL